MNDSAPVGPGALDRRRLLLGGLAGLALPAAVRAAGVEESVEDGVDGEDEPVLWSLSVVLVRHAQKQAGEDPELTAAGQAASRWLAALLAGTRVSHLEHSDTRRTAHTLAPLAAATGIEPVVTDPRDVDGLGARLEGLASGTLAVVAGHSNTIPAAIVALGGTIDDLDERGFIHDEVYDRLFVLTLMRWANGSPASSTLELRFAHSG